MPRNMTLYSVNAILILTTDDRTRLFANYYSIPHPPAHIPPGTTYPGANPYPTLKDQKAFEKGLWEKTKKQHDDIILYDNRLVLFKTEGDVMLYVVGGPDESEHMLLNVVMALRDSLNYLLPGGIDKRTIIENYDTVCIAIDEIIDGTVILETDFHIVTGRVTKRPQADAPNIKNIDLSERGINNLWEFGKQKFAESMRQGL